MKEFRHKCELRLLVCQPNPLRPDRVTVGFVLRDIENAEKRIEVRMASDLRVIHCVYPEADLDAIKGTLLEMQSVLKNVSDVEGYLQHLPFEESVDFSILPGAAVLTDSIDDEVALLTEQYLTRAEIFENREADAALVDGENADGQNADDESTGEKQLAPAPLQRDKPNQSGRPYIRRKMHQAFSSYGIWKLLQKDIPTSDYVDLGTPLKLDFGYQNRMDTSYNILQAVSVVVNPREASGLALSWTRIRDGIIARKGGSCKMYSIVEDPKFHKSEAALSLLEFMRKEGLIVRPVSDMQSLAAEAAIAMRLS